MILLDYLPQTHAQRQRRDVALYAFLTSANFSMR
jgi:hypothetical protein